MKPPFPIFDTHTHHYFEAIATREEAVVEADRADGVRHSVQIGCDEVSSLAAIALARRHEGMYATIGLHPCDVQNVGEAPRAYSGFEKYAIKAPTHAELWEVFADMYEQNKDVVVGFGETGFDRYHADTPELVQLQHDCFVAHLKLCTTYDQPVVIHTRNATAELLQFLGEHMPKGAHRGVVHCFSEGPEVAHRVTAKHGLFVGFGGVCTYPKSTEVRAAIAATPIEFIVTETDAPFLVPHKHRKTEKVNRSGYIRSVIETIAEVKQLPLEVCAHHLFENGKRLYGISS